MMPSVDFASAPFLVIWETTQACDLSCVHCRASAQPLRHPEELSTEEGFKLMADVAQMGTPVFILSGGDPAKRPDLLDLVREGKRLGLRMGTVPAATPTLSEELVRDLKQAGLDQMALSLDYPQADLHDGFRSVKGAFAKTMEAAEWAHRNNLPLQINTTLWAGSVPYLSEMAEVVERLGAVFWEVFFLVPVGRGEALDGIEARRCEELFAILYEVQKKSHFILKVTEAPHYRRYVAQREAAGDSARPAHGHPGHGGMVSMPEMLRRSEGPGHTIGFAPHGVNAGKGFVFVSHLGEVYPSGFLPKSAGNVRSQSLSEIYRNSPLMRELRDPDALHGRCRQCEYRSICGGSRSRAYALTGDYLATDPWCAYQPRRARA
ncbi:MAG TPA: TIGR04053 family radical SAM/SPASM domain-containing protein [Terriglobia bacterium]|nr:TIGR04053 family radical SAM/SPASM domain-containing protein [Terriglobia bacterium]